MPPVLLTWGEAGLALLLRLQAMLLLLWAQGGHAPRRAVVGGEMFSRQNGVRLGSAKYGKGAVQLLLDVSEDHVLSPTAIGVIW